MLIPGLLLALVAPASAALPCALTKADLKSLACVEDRYTQDKIAALPAAQQKELCGARRFLARVRAGKGGALTQKDWIKDDWRFLTDDELKVVGPVESRILADMMKKKGLARGSTVSGRSEMSSSGIF